MARESREVIPEQKRPESREAAGSRAVLTAEAARGAGGPALTHH